MDVEIGDTLIQLAEAADLDDSIALCRALARKPRRGEDREKLRNLARKLAERFPDEPGLHVAIATMLLRSGTLGEAHETCRHIKRAFPDEERVHELLGEVLMRMGDPRGAVIAFERSLTLEPNVAVEEVLTEARLLSRTQDGRPPEAVAADAKEILGEAAEPLAVRRRGLSEVKTPMVHDVRSMVDGLSGRPPTPGRANYRSRAVTGPERSITHVSAAPTQRASIPPSASIPPPAPDLPLPRAKVEEPVLSRRAWIVGLGAIAVAVGAGGVFAARTFGDGIGLDHAVVDLAVQAMLTAKPSQLDRATALLRRALVGAPRSSEAGVRAMQASIFGVLDGRESSGGLDASIEEAKARGAAAPEVASGEALALLLRGDAAGAKTRLDGVEPAGRPIDTVALNLVRGLVLERVSDAGALAAYEAALAAEPKAIAPALRLARARVVEGDLEGATKMIEAIRAAGADQGPLASALEALARATGLAVGGAAAPTAAQKLGDDLPKSLHAAGLALGALASADPQQMAAMFGAAVLEAESATDAALLGLLALRRGVVSSATFATSRASDLGAGDPRAGFVTALVAYANGDLPRVASTGKRLPDRLAATCTALLAYEAQDVPALRTATAKAAAPYVPALQIAVVRLSGERVLGAAELATLAKTQGFIAQVVAVDASLDRGERADLETAGAILKSWPVYEARGAVRAVRTARLLRLQGDKAGARAALREAGDSAMPGTLLEAILLREKSEAATLRERVEAAPGSVGPWLRALERATAKDGAAAKKLLRGVALPEADASTTVRVVAVLALNATGEGSKAKPLVKQLTALWPANADLARAAKSVDDDEDAGPAGAAPAAPGAAPGGAASGGGTYD